VTCGFAVATRSTITSLLECDKRRLSGQCRGRSNAVAEIGQQELDSDSCLSTLDPKIARVKRSRIVKDEVIVAKEGQEGGD
jgi:hypothetical protein